MPTAEGGRSSFAEVDRGQRKGLNNAEAGCVWAYGQPARTRGMLGKARQGEARPLRHCTTSWAVPADPPLRCPSCPQCHAAGQPPQLRKACREAGRQGGRGGGRRAARRGTIKCCWQLAGGRARMSGERGTKGGPVGRRLQAEGLAAAWLSAWALACCVPPFPALMPPHV